MFNVGQKVKILHPFNEEDEYKGIFTIKTINEENTYVLFEEIEPAFDFKYIEACEE